MRRLSSFNGAHKIASWPEDNKDNNNNLLPTFVRVAVTFMLKYTRINVAVSAIRMLLKN